MFQVQQTQTHAYLSQIHNYFQSKQLKEALQYTMPQNIRNF